MSRLVLTLKAGETMLIEGAELYFPATTRLHLMSQVRFVYGRQYMREQDATTDPRRFYYALQQHYAGPLADRPTWGERAFGLRHSLPAHLQEDGVRILELAAEGQHYPAMKAARTLYELHDTARESAA
jgi:flagellar protein FlbT